MEDTRPPVMAVAPPPGELVPPQPFVAAPASWAANTPLHSFFPTGASAVGTTATQGDGPATAVPGPINWASHLAVKAHEERLRAWDRVATSPVSRRFCTRHTIMRRTQICSRTRVRVVSPANPRPELAAQIDGPEHPARRRKLAGGEGEQEEEQEHEAVAQFCGEPMGAGEVEELWSRAENSVLDRYFKHPSLNLFRDVRDARMGRLHQCSGTKRWREDEDAKRTNMGSFSLRLYTRLTPLLADAWKKLGLVSEEGAKSMVSNQKIGKMLRDPRRHLAQEGMPDLSTIGDATEPDSSRDAIVPPASTIQSTSPLKRKDRLDAHFDTAQDRLRQKMVKLCPSSTTADGISPTKPTSPTTPSEKPSPARTHGIASTGRALGGSLFPLGEPATSGPAQSPTKTFRVPSCSPSTFNSTTDSLGGGSIVGPAETPVRRPGAPTPSRWARPDFATPLSRGTAFPGTPGSNKARVDSTKLTDSIPGSLETPVGTPSHWERDPRSFEFDSQTGAGTPDRNNGRVSFGSTAQYTPTSGHDQGRRLVERKRRKSEPLVQKHFMKLKQSRRQSMEPSKLRALVEEQAEFDSDSATDMVTPVPQKSGSTLNSHAPEASDTKADATVPLSSFFTERTPPSKRRDPTTPFHDRNTYDIDVRQNLDIFGAKTPTKASQQSASRTPDATADSTAVQRLADMVEDRCEGLAKVMTVEENGRLVVRFKLPIKYAAMFPESQGPDESRFTSTPSAISCSPRIKFDPVPIAPPSETREDPISLSTPVEPTSNLLVQFAASTNSSPIRDDTISQIFNQHHVMGRSGNHLAADHLPQATPTLATPLTPGFQPVVSDADQTLVVGDFDMTADQTVRTPRARAIASSSPAVHTPSQLHTPINPQTSAQEENLEAPSSGLISDISFEPTFQTPTHGNLSFSPSEQKQETVTVSPAQPPSSVEERNTTPEETTQTPTMTKARASPPLNTSFTPVNKPASHSRETTPSAGANSSESGPSSQPNTTPRDARNAKIEGVTAARDHQQQHDDETREYLSAFLKRSTKPKRSSTTDAGSPIAHTPVRLPLGDKSPNRASESPDKTKRKRGAGEPENSPVKQDPAAKKARIGPRVGRPRGSTQAGSKLPAQKVSKAPHKAAEKDKGNGEHDEPAVRRSSRLNTKESTTALPTAVPTAIKLNRTGAAKDHWPTLNSAVRNEQAELTRQTNANTRKNRGKAETVQQILARVSSEECSGDDTDESKTNSKASKRGKTVAWKDPIEAHQVQKPGRGRPLGQKARAQPAPEEKKVTKSAPKSRIAKPSAASLGRTSNGTPAKRVTRSRARGVA